MSSSDTSAAAVTSCSFLSDLSDKERSELTLTLDTFVLQHLPHHRPIALVSSGGTACDLELNSVRCLENFSTGLRGAISVEEFLQRGYAVIHLMREGSTAPFARAVNQHLGLRQTDYSLNTECIGRLLVVEGDAIDEEEELVKAVLEQEQEDDTFLTDASRLDHSSKAQRRRRRARDDEVSLARSVVHSIRIHKALKARATALKEQRLLTITFRTVEEYLAKLQLSSECLKDCRSLAIFYLTAAVSDFYIPKTERAEHKIQSSSDEDNGTGSGGGGNCLCLNLKPVPKALGTLRSLWAPDAFVVSFKLETDMDLLRHKMERSVVRYKSHLVVGNLLHSRHHQVWIFSPDEQRHKIPSIKNNNNSSNTANNENASSSTWSVVELTRSRSSSVNDDASLESSLIDFVVQSHFEYISFTFHQEGSGSGSSNTSRLSGVRVAERAQKVLEEKKRRVQRELFWKQVKSVGIELVGSIAAVAISYFINAALQRRIRRDQ